MYLLALEQGLSKRGAANHAAPTRDIRRFHELEKRDPEFAEQVCQAVEAGTDVLEDEARRRAFEGVEKPVYQGGKLVGTVREYSDTLLIFLLNGRRPEKFRPLSRVEVTGARGGPVEIEDRSASLADVARVLEAVGALTQVAHSGVAGLGGAAARPALPAAPTVLAEPGSGQ